MRLCDKEQDRVTDRLFVNIDWHRYKLLQFVLQRYLAFDMNLKYNGGRRVDTVQDNQPDKIRRE